MKKHVWLIVAVILLLVIGGYYFYYQTTVHDYASCRKAGGQIGQNNENFYCKLNGRWYWNLPDIR